MKSMSRCYDAIRCDINNDVNKILALQIDKVGDIVNNKYLFD